jgi:hypothetical protein
MQADLAASGACLAGRVLARKSTENTCFDSASVVHSGTLGKRMDKQKCIIALTRARSSVSDGDGNVEVATYGYCAREQLEDFITVLRTDIGVKDLTDSSI